MVGVNAELFSRDKANVPMLLSLLEEEPTGVADFSVRYHALQILIGLSSSLHRLQEVGVVHFVAFQDFPSFRSVLHQSVAAVAAPMWQLKYWQVCKSGLCMHSAIISTHLLCISQAVPPYSTGPCCADSFCACRQAVLAYPAGAVRLMDMLGQREVVRNEALLLLIVLAHGNADIQKIVAFEGGFERLLNIIRRGAGCCPSRVPAS